MDKRIAVIVTLALVASGTTFGSWAIGPQTKPAAPAIPAKPVAAHNAEAEADEEDKDDEEDAKDETKEETIKLADAPEAVRNAVAKLTSADKVTKVIKETDEGVTVFEVEYTVESAACSAAFSSAGDVLELEKGVNESAVPAAIMAALKKEFPKATLKDFNSVQKFYYEVDVVIDGKKHEVKVDASGEIDDEEGDEGGGDEDDAPAKAAK